MAASPIQIYFGPDAVVQEHSSLVEAMAVKPQVGAIIRQGDNVLVEASPNKVWMVTDAGRDVLAAEMSGVS